MVDAENVGELAPVVGEAKVDRDVVALPDGGLELLAEVEDLDGDAQVLGDLEAPRGRGVGEEPRDLGRGVVADGNLLAPGQRRGRPERLLGISFSDFVEFETLSFWAFRESMAGRLT